MYPLTLNQNLYIINKIITINIGGVIFDIKEHAYETPQNYINDIKSRFAPFKDSFEIVTDTENRIAEMFSEILIKENKQVIVYADVNTVIAKMGTPLNYSN